MGSSSDQLVAGGMWALLDVIEENDLINRVDKVEAKVSCPFILIG